MSIDMTIIILFNGLYDKDKLNSNMIILNSNLLKYDGLIN